MPTRVAGNHGESCNVLRRQSSPLRQWRLVSPMGISELRKAIMLQEEEMGISEIERQRMTAHHEFLNWELNRRINEHAARVPILRPRQHPHSPNSSRPCHLLTAVIVPHPAEA